MNEPTERDKRAWFTTALQHILAVEFPKADDDLQIIYLLFSDEDYLKAAFYFLKDYGGTGFSLIIEEVNPKIINLKIYEPDTDDFHVCENIPIRTNILNFYKESYQPDDTFLSVGLMEMINNIPKIKPIETLRVSITSISFD